MKLRCPNNPERTKQPQSSGEGWARTQFRMPGHATPGTGRERRGISGCVIHLSSEIRELRAWHGRLGLSSLGFLELLGLTLAGKAQFFCALL